MILNYISFVAAVLFYILLVWTNVYLLMIEPGEFVWVCVAGLHAIFGIGFCFYILFRAFYGAALGGPCWLLYKVSEGFYIFISFSLLLKS